MSAPTEDDRAKAAELSPCSATCSRDPEWHDEFYCDCGAWERQQAIATALAAAREEGRDSVGLGDFLPGGCDAEERAPSYHFAETYGDWLDCTRSKGHDDDHEHEDSGFTWPRNDDEEPRP